MNLPVKFPNVGSATCTITDGDYITVGKITECSIHHDYGCYPKINVTIEPTYSDVKIDTDGDKYILSKKDHIKEFLSMADPTKNANLTYATTTSTSDCSGHINYASAVNYSLPPSLNLKPILKQVVKTDKKSPLNEKELVNLDVDHIIFNDPATIVFWGDGTKTVVKCTKGQKFNKYFGFCAAVTKHVFENNNRVNKIVSEGFDAESPLKKSKEEKKPDKKSSKKGKKHD